MSNALHIEGLAKTFPGTRALKGVTLDCDWGEVLALLGHNGSGKSTLIKILAGFHDPDPGALATVDGEELSLGSSEDAKNHGLRFVHQDLGLIHELNAVDNVALTIGYVRRAGRIAQSEQIVQTNELLARFGVELDVMRPLSEATAVERTCVAIARAMWDCDDGPRILVLDEPTAALPSREVSRLFDVIEEVRAANHAVIYVSHRLDEIFQIADKVSVLRAGEVVLQGDVAEQTPRQLSEVIAGHELEEAPDRTDEPAAPAGVPRLRVRGLRGADVDGVDLDIRPGEIVGVAGLVGSGRDELPYLLAGATPSESDGPWEVDGEPIETPTSTTAGSHGIAFVPADRAREGMITNFTVGENLTFGALAELRSHLGRMSPRALRRTAVEWLGEVGVLTETVDRPVASLSGGNQQRVLLARSLFTYPRVLVLTEPTAGVDVGAREGLYELLRERTETGLSIVLASSDADDLVSVCDRVLVMRNGSVVAELTGTEINARRIVSVMEQAE